MSKEAGLVWVIRGEEDNDEDEWRVPVQWRGCVGTCWSRQKTDMKLKKKWMKEQSKKAGLAWLMRKQGRKTTMLFDGTKYSELRRRP